MRRVSVILTALLVCAAMVFTMVPYDEAAADSVGVELTKDTQKATCLLEEPAATALYDGQKLSESKIILGKVRINNSEVAGHFKWEAGANTTVSSSDDKSKYGNTFLARFVPDQAGVGDYYYCYLKVPVYRRNFDKAFSFVWHSEIRKPELGISDADFRENYPYILDSFSLGSLYRKDEDFRNLSTKDAARETARALAKMPEGYRSVSVEDGFTKMMGGMMYAADQVAIGKAAANLEEKDWKLKEALYSSIGSKDGQGYVFLDAPVHYKSSVDSIAKSDYDAIVKTQKEDYGIKENSSGCARTAEMLGEIFSEVKKLGMDVDYVTTDIEGVGCTTWELSRKKRLLFGAGVSNENAKWQKLWDAIRSDEDMWSQFKNRGFWTGGNDSSIACLDTVRAAAGGQYGNNYGDTKYGILKRRNVAIWDSVMQSYTNSLFDKYIAGPVKKYYPNAKVSVYSGVEKAGYVNYSVRGENYLGGTTTLGSSLHSSPTLYGNNYGLNEQKLSMDDRRVKIDGRTAFSAVQNDINELRQAVLSSDKKPIPYCSSQYFWPGLTYSSSDEANGNTAANLKSVEYYHEMLYHLWMTDPQAVYAYLNRGDVRVYRPDLEMTSGSSALSAYSQKKYYQGAYGDLNGVLKDLNDILPAPVDKQLNTELLDGTDHFILSGVKCGDKNVWRVTYDLFNGKNLEEDLIRDCVPTLLQHDGEYAFNLGGSTIRFENVSRIKQTGYGCWIVTDSDEYPSIQKGSIDIDHSPAYSVEEAGTAGGLDSVDPTITVSSNYMYTRLRHLTTFGEFSPHFRIKAKLNFSSLRDSDEYYILHFSGDPKITGEKLKKLGLQTGKDYEFEAEVTAEKIAGEGGSELVRYNKKIYVTVGGKSELVAEVNNPERPLLAAQSGIPDSTVFSKYIANTLTICGPKTTVTAKTLSFNQTSENVKFEVFRKSDGVNISRVNNGIKGLENVVTKTGEALVGKISWLNATDSDARYTVVCEQLNKEKNALEDCTTEQEVTAPANDNSFRILDVPTAKSGVSYIRTTVKKGNQALQTVVIPVNGSEYTVDPVEERIEKAKKKLAATKGERDPCGSTFRFMRLRAEVTSAGAIRLKWEKIKCAKSYVVFGSRCGEKYTAGRKMKKRYLKITLPDRDSQRSMRDTYSKCFIAAFDKNGRLICVSKAIHFVPEVGKYGNFRAIVVTNRRSPRKRSKRFGRVRRSKKVKRSVLYLRKGRTFRLKTCSIKASKRRKVQVHRKTRFESSNPRVAAVSCKGTIWARKKGVCTIYAYTQNGVYTTVHVVVR